MTAQEGIGNGIVEALMDDFYAESDEHMDAVRNDLVLLETREKMFDPAILEDLFRRFHTLKGLAGMVGLDPAEDAAHSIESFLRTLREQKIPRDHGRDRRLCRRHKADRTGHWGEKDRGLHADYLSLEEAHGKTGQPADPAASSAGTPEDRGEGSGNCRKPLPIF